MPITPIQLSYSQNPREAFPGMIADAFGPQRVKARFARGLIKAGFGVFRSSGAGTPAFGAGLTDPGEVYHIPSPPAAVNATALASAIASSTAVQNVTVFNGTYGASELQPPRQVTFAFSATGWNSTTGTLTYVNDVGVTVSESVAIANSANLTTTGSVKKLVSFSIPAQGGTAGTVNIGIVALASLTEGLFDGVVVNQDFARNNSSSALYGYPGQQTATTANYIDGQAVPVLSEGGIWVYTETAVSENDPVYVRTAINGSLNILGAFANASGTGLTQLTKARWARDASFPAQGETGNGVAWLRLSYL